MAGVGARRHSTTLSFWWKDFALCADYAGKFGRRVACALSAGNPGGGPRVVRWTTTSLNALEQARRGVGPSRAADFDGAWSVLIQTESGDCDRAYRYPVRVQNGRVVYNPDPGFGGSFTISGRVDRAGRVEVSVRRGDQAAFGRGRLEGDSGTGTWSGSSPSNRCAGSWTAERRG